MVSRARSGFAKTSADLTPATGARTTRLCRPHPVFAKRLRRAFEQAAEVLSKARTAPSSGAPSSLMSKLTQRKLLRPALPRPPPPAPYVRDDRDTPLLWARDGKSFRVDLGESRSGIFLCEARKRFAPSGKSLRSPSCGKNAILSPSLRAQRSNPSRHVTKYGLLRRYAPRNDEGLPRPVRRVGKAQRAHRRSAVQGMVGTLTLCPPNDSTIPPPPRHAPAPPASGTSRTSSAGSPADSSASPPCA